MDFVQKLLLTVIAALVIALASFALQSGQIKVSNKNASPHHKPSFVILGNNGSGKTGLYYRLIEDSQGENNTPITNTVSSIEPNFTEISLPFSSDSISKKYQLVDYPGHLKYHQLLNKLLLEDITLGKISGIAYVIDSSSAQFNANVELISKFLFNLFSVTERKTNGIDVLFVVNKTDLFDSTPVHRIRTILETEINKLIQNELSTVDKNSGIDKDDDEEEQGIVGHETLREFWLGVLSSANSKFTFDKLEGSMDFIGGSVLKNKVEGWENWIDEKVVN
ncbi:P-loop containing nucleoside triphosphate hydrolase protein [Suhomyces tanzawaensis NRRL Y-17324]|uniref:Signal recognition particle receptor subunit beta n=1 Tax=Suhomyces tanzawaensis NRRL Y-17324 TaxID=984487 RepID=A0A1E4SL85_9ASCO|nr:P-loop containing nucleoside triphosphate hydrolase protein [Suhomyces tanzawaensis NRRL Y-17324]ODV80269.1 P-loop containing nucleoside triphosphate hydrolase protein [Suhomyces tanzawaensis NRRL Y-17324]